MKTDVEIAQEAEMRPIQEIAAKLGITEDELELYGKYKAKVTPEAFARVKDQPNGKLVLVICKGRLMQIERTEKQRFTGLDGEGI